MDDDLLTPPRFDQPNALTGLALRLVKEGWLSAAAAGQAEREANGAKTSLLQHVIESGLVSASQATLAAAREYGLPLVAVEALRLECLPPLDNYPAALLRELCAVPLVQRAHSLTVAVPYPSSLAHLDKLRFATGVSIDAVLSPVDQLVPVLEAYLTRRDTCLTLEPGEVDDAVSELDADYHLETPEPADTASPEAADEAPIVKFVHKILMEAIQRGASDIHFEPYADSYRIRMRVDGMLVEASRPPFAMRARIAARLKVMARLDISERRLPQDGAIKLKMTNAGPVDFRVNSLPTVYGEKLVLRLLDPAAAQIGIDALGFTPQQRELFESALRQPQGMVLVTGPTGSGKTVTLYTGLNLLNQVERNICTAEDPVEIKVPGVNQVNVLPKIGLDFASALRAFLRQDPDVVMVGEIRDLETAEIAVKAAQTGHLVLSTLHTNSAADTLTRLANMGVAPFNIASSVSLIIAQRLARRLCPRCRQPVSLSREALLRDAMLHEGISAEALEQATLFDAVGCTQCTQGYKGRIGIYEVVPVNDAMRELILHGGSAAEFDALARQEGYPDLRRSGLAKVLQGLTSLTEIHRITQD